METRTCPPSGCAGPCARFESDDPTPWTHDQPGWDRADFSCGRCGHKDTTTTEAAYVRARQLHAAAHDVAAVLTSSPEIRSQVLRLLGLSE